MPRSSSSPLLNSSTRWYRLKRPTWGEGFQKVKHNLNAQAIGSLQDEFAGLELEIDKLIDRMNEAIESSNAFIADMQTS